MLGYLKSSKLGRKLLMLQLRLLSFINQLLPKDQNKILIYESGRTKLEDNSEALYNWLLQEGFTDTHRIICCVPNEKHEAARTYKPVGALRGVIEYLTAGYMFYSFGDFRIKPSKKQTVVNLWHGTPIKTIGKMTGYHRYLDEKLDNFSWICATSENVAPVMAEAFGCELERVMIVGHPRTDYFTSTINALEKLGIDRNHYKKIVLWMPTFRIAKEEGFADGDIDESETSLPIVKTMVQLVCLNEALEELGLLMLIKPHPCAEFSCESLSSIRCITNTDLDIAGIRLYEFVKDCDALITDYSSIYCDYLLLDRPICFTVDDLDKYGSTRGFSFENVTELMPGPHVATPQDLINFLRNLALGVDDFKAQRHIVNEFFNAGSTKDNCAVLAKKCGLFAVDGEKRIPTTRKES